MKHILVLCLLFSVTAPAALAQETQQDRASTPLSLGQVLNDSLAATDIHTYTLDLAADQFVSGEVNQRTVDIVVTIYGPDDKVVGTFDGPAKGPEPFQFDTEAAGRYRIEIKPFEQATGHYTVAVHRIEAVAGTPAGRVDQLMVAYDREDVPGGVVAVIRNGDVAFAKAYGMANLTHNIPFSTETLSNIGSVSKQFTAFAVTLLAAQGKLSLDDDIRDHITELPDLGETVTLRHFLTHTSGYREFLNTVSMAGRRLDEGDYIDREELIEIVQRQPALQNVPGAEWNYNNTGYGLLTVVVERVTGQPFPAWMNEHVFGPLGMAHTVVRAHQAQVVPNSAQGYVSAEEGGYREATDLGAAMGAGAMYTTVGDLAKWIRNFHTAEVGGADVIRQMTTSYVLTNGDTTNYGLGLSLDEQRGLRRIQHGGADVAHRAMLMYYPEIDAGVVTLSNNGSFSGSISGKVSESFFGEHMTPEDAEEPTADAAPFDPEHYDPEDFDALAGRYELEEAAGFVLAFTREDDQFFVQATGQPKVEIVPMSDSTFAIPIVDARITFHRGEDGAVPSLTLHQNGDHPAKRLDEEMWTPSVDDLAAFTGYFFSKELETFYTIALEDSGLVVKHRRLEEVALTPTTEDTFRGSFPVAEIAFTRDEAGRITGFTAANGRTRDVRFERQN